MSKANFLLLFLATFFMHSAFAEDSMQNAEYYYENGEYSTATIYLKNQLKSYPQHAKARYLLGNVYLKIRKYKYAEKELGKAHQIKPDNISYRLDYARSLLLNNKYEEIKALLKVELEEVEPEGERLAILGSVYSSKEQYEQAKHYFQQALLKGNIKANIGLANIALYEKNIKEADILISKLLDVETDNVIAWNVKAQILESSEQYQQALEIYTRLINENDNSNDLYLRRAAVFLILNKVPEADADIKRVLKKDNKLPMANYLMAKLNFKKKNYKQADIFTQRVLNSMPKHKPSIYISGEANFALNKLYQAEKRFLEYLSLEANNLRVQNLLAQVYLAMNKAHSAILILESLPEDTNNFAALKTLTIAYMSIGEFSKAQNILQQAFKNNPDNSSIKKLLVSSRAQALEITGMMKELELYGESYKSAKLEDYLLLASYFQQNKFTKFEKQLNQFIDLTPDDPNLYVIKAKYELYNNNNYAAQALFNKALEYNENHIPALSGLAKLVYNDYHLSSQYYQRIIAIDNKNSMAYLELSQLAEQNDNLIAAEKYLYELYDLNKGNINNEVKLAIILIKFFERNQMHLKKDVVAKDLLKNNPDNLLALSLMYDVQVNLKQDQQAEKSIRKLINIDSENVKYYLSLAALLAKQDGNEEELFSLWDTAFSLNRTNPKALITKYNYQLQNKHYEAALNTANQIEDNFPSLKAANKLTGDIYFLQDKKDLALESYLQAFKLKPDSKLAIKIAKLQVLQGATDDAIVFLQKQLNNQSINIELILFHLAELYQTKKHYHLAIEYYGQLLERQPKNPMLLNNLAWSYININDPMALVMAEKAYEIQPESAIISDTYGYILLINNNAKKAVQVLNKAAILAADNKEIQFHLAKGYYLQGENDKAISILNKITQGSDTFAERESAQKLLDQLNKKQ